LRNDKSERPARLLNKFSYPSFLMELKLQNNTFQRIVVKHLMYYIGKATCLFKLRIVHKHINKSSGLGEGKKNFKMIMWLDFVVKQIMWSVSKNIPN
jgi:hypothetical protein